MMNDLKKGTKITLRNGGEATVIKKLDDDEQGAVYLVDYAGKDLALRLYTKRPTDEFLKNLENIISKGKPNNTFLWPEILTEQINGSVGFLMALRPKYKEFSDFLLAKVKFKDLSAMITAATRICKGIEELHGKGFIYADLNDDNILINPQTGDILICNNDSICEFGNQIGIAGKSRYMAPEIVTGKSNPDQWSDRFSLSVILFLLFFNNHPLEGLLTTSIPVMTEKNEKKLYGESPVFIWDENDPSNRPVQGIHNNVIKRWELFPDILRNTFLKAFSKEAMTIEHQSRISASEWIKVLDALKNMLVTCPHCKNETFQNTDEAGNQCINCGRLLQEDGISLTKEAENNFTETFDIRPLDRDPISRKTMVLFFVVDTSDSMAGSIIDSVNDAIHGILPELKDFSAEFADAQIKIAVLQFSSGAKWLYDRPVDVETFRWNDLHAGGTSDFGKALKMLNQKLSQTEFMKEPESSFSPVILLISGSVPTDSYKTALKKLKANKWFNVAIKIAIAIGDDAKIDILKEFTGNSECVLLSTNPKDLKRMIRFVDVSASEIKDLPRSKWHIAADDW